MAEPTGLPKPGDLFIGVIDFFAILVPGVIAAMFVAWAKGAIPEKPDALFYGTILLAGFVLGHILHGIGSFLDVLLYDPLFRPQDSAAPAHGFRARLREYFRSLKNVYGNYFRANDALHLQARGVTGYPPTADPIRGGATAPPMGKIGSDGRTSPPGGMYQWARAWLRMHSPEATAELDRLEADSKLFRSLSVIALVLVLSWNTFPHLVVGELPLAILVLIFSLWRYCDLRQKMVRACYLHYVQVRSEPIAAQAAAG